MADTKTRRRNKIERPLNDPSWVETFACLMTAHGYQQIGLSDTEAARYDADPDNWAAKYFGLTLEQYYEWVERGRPPALARQ
jgi:hypothetical protein